MGVTATPNRPDGTGLRSNYDEVVYDLGIDKGIKLGYLVDLRCWRVATGTNLDAIHVHSGKLDHAETAKTVNTPQRNALAVKAWARHALNRRTLVFSEDVQHALDLAEAFKAVGVKAEAVWGDDPDRRLKLSRFESGEAPVLVNCRLLTEGYDDRDIECIILTWPTKSALLLQQMIGRGTRLPTGSNHISEVPESGKRAVSIIEMGDITSRHNLCTVPSLLGIPKQLNMDGGTYQSVKAQIERVAHEFPAANLADLKDIGSLKQISEQVHLFKVSYPPEIKEMTALAWRAQGDGYFLPVMKGRLTLARDIRDDWWVRGIMGERKIELHAQNLAGAFNMADRAVHEFGNMGSLVNREARWRNRGPSDRQIALCKKVGLNIPVGATRGQVSAALDAKFSARRNA